MTVTRTTRLAAAALAVALTVVAGCGSGDAQSGGGDAPTRVFAADNGEIKIPVKPKRVIATGYAVPALLEAKAPLVGISTWKRGLPMMTTEDRKKYDELPKVAGEQAAETNYEAIAQADPDLIVIGVPKPVLADIDVKRLQEIAPVVAIGPSVPSAWRELSRKQSDAAGALAGFDAARQEYEAKAKQLADKYKAVLPQLKLGHVGAYGEVAKGNFQREFDNSWGTNIAQDLGAKYYGQVKVKGGGSKDVSEYPSIEELPTAFAQADAITYSVKPDGSVPPAVKYVLDSPLWKNLPAVKAGKTFAFRYTEAATYRAAMKTLDAVDQAFAPLLKK
ncbi:ABC transporter substrate-binding protein [Amycolatopsis rubida]|uniref:ABC transporter substrate-binding protein n=1 Tax=Amycolatopsis rubida TaxID=112413 RepID=A0A1I6B5A3_9PSEU|nr:MULTISPECIES: ABC transporter substrate-binding protein [Amycolatopsis]MYW90618.1 ABC transporter substrate-binding protein [Amycolatopsis rubida]NEC55599.1 ABC transporter substrate-binding protein [Amycolatopsis rubida]OAP29094.1 Fe(3+)-citrate-binding protein YfmC precursor [Amycolatopsis sp. M39]SFQ76128.1 iron complex transport system substrate-binding protein [Amycolatopsis rubida]